MDAVNQLSADMNGTCAIAKQVARAVTAHSDTSRS